MASPSGFHTASKLISGHPDREAAERARSSGVSIASGENLFLKRHRSSDRSAKANSVTALSSAPASVRPGRDSEDSEQRTLPVPGTGDIASMSEGQLREQLWRSTQQVSEMMDEMERLRQRLTAVEAQPREVGFVAAGGDPLGREAQAARADILPVRRIIEDHARGR